MKHGAGRWFCIALTAGILAGVCASSGTAAVVARDLLGGLGGFENSYYTNWISSYTGSDFDWNAPGRWSYGPKGDYRWGCDLSTENNAVAEGWNRESGLNPDKNLVYKLVDNGSGKSQFFSIRNLPSGYGAAHLKTSFTVGEEAYKLNVGDTVTFTMDSIKMDDYSGPKVTYRLVLQGVEASSVTKDLTPSSIPFFSSVSGKVAAGAKSVNALVSIIAWQGTGSGAPGIYVDGAHLTIKRGGVELTEEVPVRRSRSVRTYKLFCTSSEDAYSLARYYDETSLKYESDYWFARRLKYYNPDIKVYLYEGPWVADWREPEYGNRDGLWSNTALGMGYVLKHDADSDTADWLYPKLDKWSPEQNLYYVHFGDKTYQEVWAARAFAKVRDYKLDGLHIDGPAVKLGSDGFAEIQPWEEQSFLHYVMSKRPAGINVMHNSCSCNLIDGFDPKGSGPWQRWPEQGRIVFDPTWKPHQTAEYTESEGYTANTPDNTFDCMYQEYAFFGYGDGRNQYKQSYAQNCLNDMDKVKQWNSSLPANRRKSMCMGVRGADLPGDLAYGIDGWVNFGLCCYLLGQNDWTTLGFRVTANGQTVSPTAPYGETANLGPAAGDRTMKGAIGQRRYYGSDAGAKGGVIVANTASTGQGVYVPQFDGIDQDGAYHPAGSAISLGAHTGRILYHQSNYKYVSVITSPTDGGALAGANCVIRGKAIANRPDLSLPATVQVNIDDGGWIDCPVDANGNWSISRSLSVGLHTLSSRVYVSPTDYEPDKKTRNVTVNG